MGENIFKGKISKTDTLFLEYISERKWSAFKLKSSSRDFAQIHRLNNQNQVEKLYYWFFNVGKIECFCFPFYFTSIGSCFYSNDVAKAKSSPWVRRMCFGRGWFRKFASVDHDCNLPRFIQCCRQQLLAFRTISWLSCKYRHLLLIFIRSNLSLAQLTRLPILSWSSLS